MTSLTKFNILNPTFLLALFDGNYQPFNSLQINWRKPKLNFQKNQVVGISVKNLKIKNEQITIYFG